MAQSTFLFIKGSYVANAKSLTIFVIPWVSLDQHQIYIELHRKEMKMAT